MEKTSIIILIIFVALLLVESFLFGVMYEYKSIPEKTAPSNYINSSQIHIYSDRFCVDVENPSMSRYEATGSMKPTLDENSNGIRIVPNESQINVGDLITYKSGNEFIAHRVFKIGYDPEWYAITLGDNNAFADGKVRFRDVKYKTIAVIW